MLSRTPDDPSLEAGSITGPVVSARTEVPEVESAQIADWISRTADFVREKFATDPSAHDWWHLWRVWQVARRLATDEGATVWIVELAALLHDIADWKFCDGDLTIGPQRAAEWLAGIGVPTEIQQRGAEIIAGVSYRGAGVPTPMSTLEGACVQDADRLDAIGAIGIARAFSYGGHRGRILFDPDQPPQLHDSSDAYRQSQGPTWNHFHEKLLLLRDRMQTATGRRWAEERHAYLEQFLQQFLREWNGTDLPIRSAR